MKSVKPALIRPIKDDFELQWKLNVKSAGGMATSVCVYVSLRYHILQTLPDTMWFVHQNEWTAQYNNEICDFMHVLIPSGKTTAETASSAIF